MLSIRRLTYGDEYDFKVRCASCGQTFNMSVNLAELPIKKLEGDPDATHTITLPRTGRKVTFRLLRGRDEKKIATTLRKNPQEIIRLSLFLHTMAVDGSENFSEKFFETLPGADSQYYRKEIDAVTCGVDTVVEVECPECDNEFEVQLPISENFFFPNSRKT
jgi:ribosomal protein S27E